jgi:hypothetical protein
VSLLERAPRVEAPTPAPRRTTRTVTAGVVGAVLALVLAGLWALAPTLTRLSGTDQVVAAAGTGLMTDFGPEGTYALHYRYGEQVTLSLPVHNSSAWPVTITGAELVEPTYPLLVPVAGVHEPVEIGPFGTAEVSLTFTYTNCRYYHERANNTYDQVRVEGSVLGRRLERTVDLRVPLMVHSQVILNCPERTYVRGDDRRL